MAQPQPAEARTELGADVSDCVDDPLWYRLRWWIAVAAAEMVGMAWLLALWVR